MVSRVSLERRLGRLGKPVRAHLVIAEDGETDDQAINRHQRDHGKVVEENDRVQIVRFVGC